MLTQRLRIARKAKNLTQEELAKLVNTRKTTISNYETGYSSPSNEMLNDLADVLDVTTDYLLGRTDNQNGKGISNNLGKRIRYLRETNNLSQKAFAEKLGITNTQLSRYELGERKPDPEMISKIADHFDVSTDFLLGRENNIISVAGSEIELTKDEFKIFEELKKHPILFHDLATNPEKKVKEIIKLYKMKKMLLDDEEEEKELGNDFGELED